MSPEQPPTPHSNAGGQPDTAKQQPIYRIPLSVKDTSVGYALFHLDQNNMPARIELVQNSPLPPSRAFEITIDEPLLRAFFDPQKLIFDINGNTVAGISDMLKSAIKCARAQGHIYPTEERAGDIRSLCSISVPNSDHTVSYVSSHIPLSIEEWTFGHKRHQVSALRKDSSGTCLAELSTKSLEYPDGSILLDVTIVNFLTDKPSPTTHHFSTTVRGPTALEALAIELESLHTDITTLPISEFLAPYFLNTRTTQAIQGDDQNHNPASGQAADSAYRRNSSTYPIENSGIITLPQGSKVTWDFSHNQGNLVIYPQANNPCHQISYRHVSKFRSQSDFFRLVRDITSDSPRRIRHAVDALSSPAYVRLEISPGDTSELNILSDHLIENFELDGIKTLSSGSPTELSYSEQTFAVLEGKEWIGFQSGNKYLKEIPDQIYLRVWQGACDKIVMISHSETNSTMMIRARKDNLFSGSIPEMRTAISGILNLFSENPFHVLEHFENATPYISPLYGSTPTTALISRLSFFSELMIEGSKRSHKLSSSPVSKDSKELLETVAGCAKVVLSTNDGDPFALRLEFIEDQLESISFLRKVSFWEGFIHLGGNRKVFLSQNIPPDCSLSPKTIAALCNNLAELLQNYFIDQKNNRPSEQLLNKLRSTMFEYIATTSLNFKSLPESQLQRQT